MDFYLLANNQNLSTADTALYIRIGNTKDEISLYQRQGGGDVLLIDGLDGTTNSSSTDLRLHVKLSNDTLSLDYSTDLVNPLFSSLQSIPFDTNKLAKANVHSGLYIRQSTASFFKDHYFDYFRAASIQKDTLRTMISAFKLLDSNRVSLFFSEEISSDILNRLSNYIILETSENPISIQTQSLDSVQLQFADAFVSGQPLTLQIDTLKDLSGNGSLQQQRTFTYRRVVEPTYKSLRISEIYAKPIGSGLLSEAFELYNATEDFTSTKGLILSDLSTKEVFPELVLPPKSYWVVCDDSDTNIFSGLNTIVLKTMPSLNDAEDLIRIEHATYGLVTQVLYQRGWHNSAKGDGGWSLEMRDLVKGCCTQNNYSSSIASAGHSLGTVNSLSGPISNAISPKIESIYLSNARQLTLRWNETIDYQTATDKNNYIFNPSITIDSIGVDNAKHNEVTLYLSVPISEATEFTVNRFTSCEGVVVDAQVFTLNMPRVPNSGDLRITEIMFNAASGCSEFIEIDNTTDSILDLKNTFLGIGSSTKSEVLNISSTGHLLFPGQKLVLAQSVEALKQCHAVCDEALTLELNNWSSLDDKEGNLWITNFATTQIDSVRYDYRYHSALLSSTDGVSLEKLDTSASGLTQKAWSSSNLSQNFASPGCVNTVMVFSESEEPFSLSNPYFQSKSNQYSQAVVQYQLSKSNYSAHIEVRNRNGQHVKQLANNDLIGTKGIFFWDGTNDEGQNAALGIYFIYIKAVHGDGNSLKQVLEVTKLD